MSEPADALQVQLAKLRCRYALALPGKVAALEAAVAAQGAGAWQEESCATAYRQAHTLAGSSGTYGFPEIGAGARALEELLKQILDARTLLSPIQRIEAEGQLAILREQAVAATRKVSA